MKDWIHCQGYLSYWNASGLALQWPFSVVESIRAVWWIQGWYCKWGLRPRPGFISQSQGLGQISSSLLMAQQLWNTFPGCWGVGSLLQCPQQYLLISKTKHPIHCDKTDTVAMLIPQYTDVCLNRFPKRGFMAAEQEQTLDEVTFSNGFRLMRLQY